LLYSLPLLELPAPSGYCIKPARGIFLLSLPGNAPTMPRELFPISVWSLIRMPWDPVFRLVQRIPRGRVLTYGAVANALRLPGGARSAGRAMAATPSGKGIPWHRVVGERGKILVREPYASLQRKLLESEGIAVVESRVDLKRHLWKPPKKSARKQGTPKKPVQQ
jgi:methylated-DNA-protein-cysteine methyltransferase-like protein